MSKIRCFPPYWVISGNKTDKDCDATPSFTPMEGSFLKYREVLDDNQYKKQKSYYEWLYSMLGIMDSKASALMRLNGVMVAAASLLLRMDSNKLSPGFCLATDIFIAPAALLSTLSIACCLIVVSLDWKFLGLVEKDGDKYKFDRELSHLEKMVNFRESCYQLAWAISFCAIVIFFCGLAIFFVAVMVSHIPHETGYSSGTSEDGS